MVKYWDANKGLLGGGKGTTGAPDGRALQPQMPPALQAEAGRPRGLLQLCVKAQVGKRPPPIQGQS